VAEEGRSSNILGQATSHSYTDTTLAKATMNFTVPNEYNGFTAIGYATERSTGHQEPSTKRFSGPTSITTIPVIRRTHWDAKFPDLKYTVGKNDWKLFFLIGRIFEVLWNESSTSSDDDGSKDNYHESSVTTGGEQVYFHTRRFIVAQRNDKCCICLLVSSCYGHPRGIHLESHGFLYHNAL
jgi:hypothetical protein